jgi:tripartite-type tricarboxylate transporter receptor subunit TctC
VRFNAERLASTETDPEILDSFTLYLADCRGAVYPTRPITIIVHYAPGGGCTGAIRATGGTIDEEVLRTRELELGRERV